MHALAIPGLTLRDEVGRGASSVVYRAERDGTAYAVKVRRERCAQSADELDEDSRRFVREASVLASVREPHLERIYAVGESDGYLYLVKEFVSGTPLSERLRQRGRLSEPHVVSIAQQLAMALAEIHKRGLVHRDVKPDNVLLLDDGTIKLVDLGLAALSGEASQGVAGTLLYSAPEQNGTLKRPVDGRSDLYALGVLMFEALAGFPPFRSDDAGELLRMHAVREPPKLADVAAGVSEGLSELVAKLLAKDPDDRHASASSLLHALDDLLGVESATRAITAHDQAEEPAATLSDDELTWSESRALDAALELWSSGSGAVSLVTGAQGSGKSSVLGLLRREASQRGALVLWARAEPHGLPFAPLRDALDLWAARIERSDAASRAVLLERIREAAGESSGWLRALSPRLAGLVLEPEGHEAHVSHEHFYDLSAAFLLRLATKSGVVLVIDDYDAADSATRKVVERVVAGIDDSKLFVAMSAQSLESAGLAPESVTHVELEPISVEDVRAMLASMLGGAPPESLVTQVTRRCDGSPRSVREILRAMLDGGVLRPVWGSWDIDERALTRLQLPNDMFELLLRRAEALDPVTRQLIELSALGGRQMNVAPIARASGHDDLVVRSALLKARELGLVIQEAPSRYAFVDERLREAFAERVDESRRAEAHRRLAHALIATSTGNEAIYAIARHLYLAAVSYPSAQEAYKAQVSAGTTALLAHAIEEAITFLERAMQLASTYGLPVESSARRVLGDAYLAAGRFEDAERQLSGVIAELPACTERGVLQLRLAHAYIGTIDTQRARKVLEEALRDLGAPLARSGLWRFLTTLVQWLLGLFVGWTGIGAGSARAEESTRLAAIVECYEVLGLLAYFESRTALMVQMALNPLWPGRRLGASRELALGYSNYACLLAMLKLRAAHDYARSAIEVAKSTGEPETLLHCELYRCVVHHIMGEPLQAAALERELLQRFGDQMAAEDYLNGCSDLAWNLMMRGHFAEARAWMDRVLHRGRYARGGAGPVHSGIAYAASLRALSGDVEEGRPYLDRLRRLELGEQDRFRTSELLAHSLLFSLAAGELEGADRFFEEHEALGIHPITSGFHSRGYFVFGLHVRREQCARAERAGGAVPLELLRHATRQLAFCASTPILRAHLKIAQATCARLERKPKLARRRLAEAEALAATVDAPWIQLEALVERARLERQSGGEAGAARWARTARAVALEIGWVTRASSLGHEFELADRVRRHDGVVDTKIAASQRYSSAEAVRLRHQLGALLEISLKSSQIMDPDAQARIALDEIVRIVGAERAFLFLVDDSSNKLVLRAGRDAGGRDLGEDGSHSKSVLETVRLEGRAVVLTGTDRGEAVSTSHSVAVQGLRSVLAAPLYLKDKLTGVLYVDSRVAKGMFDAGDAEIVMALGAHISIALANARAAKVELERTALAKDLAVTAAAQSLLFPAASSARHDKTRVLGHGEPASQCGGDWWWYELLPNGLTRVIVCDVTGHGAGSAMVTAVFAAGYRAMMRSMPGAQLARVLGELDALLREVCRGSYQLTLTVVEVDHDARELRYACAGAPPFLCMDRAGRVDSIDKAGEPLGTGDCKLAYGSVALSSGMRVLLFTDGLIESPVEGKQRGFGLKRVLELLEGTRSEPAEGVQRALLGELNELRGALPAEDDVTFVVIDVD